MGWKGKILRASTVIVAGGIVLTSLFVSAKQSLKQDLSSNKKASKEAYPDYFTEVLDFFWQNGRLGYQHVWPGMKFGWRIVVGTIVGFFGAAFGSVGGVGGGGIFVPMLTLIIGFDAKSSTAISKCMVMGAAAASVHYNLKLRHPTLDLPIIDYDLALLFQPMLVLGISIGVGLNVVFSDWMVTVLLIILFLGTSTKAFFKGVDIWKTETITKRVVLNLTIILTEFAFRVAQLNWVHPPLPDSIASNFQEAARRMASNGSGSEEVEYEPLPRGPSSGTQPESNESKISEVSIMENVCWKELGILFAVWVTILALQIAKNYTATCSPAYWVLNLLQIPVAVGTSGYEAIRLYRGQRVILSSGEERTNWKLHQLALYCSYGILAGMVGGLLGLGGGFILVPLFLDMGIPPQVSSATATFAMLFSSSMSVIEYYLLKRFPISYALYFIAVASIAAFVGQHVVKKIITLLGRASLIIFILASTILVSAITLGGYGILKMIEMIKAKEYMGFDDICSYEA